MKLMRSVTLSHSIDHKDSVISAENAVRVGLDSAGNRALAMFVVLGGIGYVPVSNRAAGDWQKSASFSVSPAVLDSVPSSPRTCPTAEKPRSDCNWWVSTIADCRFLVTCVA